MERKIERYLYDEISSHAPFFNEEERKTVLEVFTKWIRDIYLRSDGSDRLDASYKLWELASSLGASLFVLNDLLYSKPINIIVYNVSGNGFSLNDGEIRRMKVTISKRIKTLDNNIKLKINYIDGTKLPMFDEFSNDLKKARNVDDLHATLTNHVYSTKPYLANLHLKPNTIKIVLMDEKQKKNFIGADDEVEGISLNRVSKNGAMYNDYALVFVDNYHSLEDLLYNMVHELGHKLFLTHVDDIFYFVTKNEFDEKVFLLVSQFFAKNKKNRTVMVSYYSEVYSPNRFNLLDRAGLKITKHLFMDEKVKEHITKIQRLSEKEIEGIMGTYRNR